MYINKQILLINNILPTVFIIIQCPIDIRLITIYKTDSDISR